MSSTIVLILLGVIALFAGMKSLILLVPIAVAIWFSAGSGLTKSGLTGSSMRNSRN
jgi:hypothetical protein